MVVADLGWVDFDLVCFTILLEQLVATVTARARELPKPKSTEHISMVTDSVLNIFCTSLRVLQCARPPWKQS